MKLLKEVLFLIIISTLVSCAQRSRAEQERLSIIKLEVELKIQKWIESHSNYPESYSSKSFSEFTISGEKEDETYLSKHSFLLRQNDSTLKEQIWNFEVKKDFFVFAASEEDGKEYNYKIGVDLESWFKKNGGRLSNEEAQYIQNTNDKNWDAIKANSEALIENKNLSDKEKEAKTKAIIDNVKELKNRNR